MEQSVFFCHHSCMFLWYVIVLSSATVGRSQFRGDPPMSVVTPLPVPAYYKIGQYKNTHDRKIVIQLSKDLSCFLLRAAIQKQALCFTHIYNVSNHLCSL